MNKAELIAAMSNETGITKTDTEKQLNAFIKVVSEELAKNGKVQLVGFGTFETVDRAERKCKNPQTGEEMTVAACKAPKFKAGKALKEKVNA